MRRIAPFISAFALMVACQPTGGGGSASPSAAESGSVLPSESIAPTGYLARILDTGVIKVSTDPAYPPQSFLNPDTNELEGFDIDVAKEIAERLGVEVEFETPSFDAVVAGSWSNRWDMSVGSVTVTPAREEVLDFTQAYYYTPAQAATTEGTGIETLDDFAGKTICVAESTTYLFWLEGTLEIPSVVITPPPEGATAVTLPTDINCPEAWRDGRTDFEGWVSSITTVDGAIADGLPVVAVGDPVFFEALGVAFDKTVTDNDSLVAEVDRIIGEMHEDGTLTELSEKWFEGLDYKVPQE